MFWENGAGLTWLLQKEEQDEYSTTANIGLYQRKYNDTGRLRDFSVQSIFHDDGGYEVTTRALRESAVLLATHGARHVVWEALSQPLTLKQLSETVGKSEDNCRKVMTANPHMFERLNPGIGGRGNEVLWQRSAAEAGRATTQSSFSSPSQSPSRCEAERRLPGKYFFSLKGSGLSGLDSVKPNEDSGNPDITRTRTRTVPMARPVPATGGPAFLMAPKAGQESPVGRARCAARRCSADRGV